MLILVLIIFTELFLLYFLSNRLTKTIYTILCFIFRNKDVAVGLLTLVYLPGTAVHELAHLIVAEILRVPTGEISFTPEFENRPVHKQEVKVGSIKIAKTDPIRRYLIGFAPVIVGLASLFLLIWLFQYYWPQFTDPKQRVLLIGIIGYLLFAVSNSMFSSKKDLEGFPAVLILLVLITAALYLAGVRLSLTGQVLELATSLLNSLTKALAIVIGVNIVVLLSNLFLLGGVRKIFH